jgi:hypothetical protein
MSGSQYKARSGKEVNKTSILINKLGWWLTAVIPAKPEA